MKLSRLFKRVAIVLLIALFSVTGIVACRNAENISGSRGSGDSIEMPDTGNVVTPGETGGSETGTTVSSSYPNSPKNGAWPDNSYREIYVPFASVYYTNAKGEPQWNRAIVSYMDSNTLTQLWKDQMDAKGKGKNVDFFLRNFNNAFVDFKRGGEVANDYYFFDENFNIRHKRWPDVIIKELVGGVMTVYNHNDPGSTGRGTVVVGGLYRTMLNDLGKVDADPGVNMFLNGRQVGDLEVLIFNVGATQASFTYFGLDILYYNGNSSSYNKLKGIAKEWYTLDRKPEMLVNVLTYDMLRTKYKTDGRTDGSYFYFSAGQAEIVR